jgi:hypothetical protein
MPWDKKRQVFLTKYQSLCGEYPKDWHYIVGIRGLINKESIYKVYADGMLKKYSDEALFVFCLHLPIIQALAVCAAMAKAGRLKYMRDNHKEIYVRVADRLMPYLF